MKKILMGNLLFASMSFALIIQNTEVINIDLNKNKNSNNQEFNVNLIIKGENYKEINEKISQINQFLESNKKCNLTAYKIKNNKNIEIINEQVIKNEIYIGKFLIHCNNANYNKIKNELSKYGKIVNINNLLNRIDSKKLIKKVVYSNVEKIRKILENKLENKCYIRNITIYNNNNTIYRQIFNKIKIFKINNNKNDNNNNNLKVKYDYTIECL